MTYGAFYPRPQQHSIDWGYLRRTSNARRYGTYTTWIPGYYVRTGILLYYWITTYHSIRLLTIVLFSSSLVDEINCRAFTSNTSSHSECQFSLEIQNTYLNYNWNGTNDGNFLSKAHRSGSLGGRKKRGNMGHVWRLSGWDTWPVAANEAGGNILHRM